MSAAAPALVFIGFMGAGKSTAAIDVAAALGVPAFDSDAVLEQRIGHSVAREFELRGEAAFRAREEEVVCELLDPAEGARASATTGPAGAGTGTAAATGAGAAVSRAISLGGGAVLSARVREALRQHVTVLLDVAPEVAWERVRGNGRGGEERPLARDRAAFVALHAERRALYEELADAFLPADVRGVAVRSLPALLALAVMRERFFGEGMGSAGALTQPSGCMLWAASTSGEYPVMVGRGLLGADAPAEVWRLGESGEEARAFCVTDETVAGLYTPPLRSPRAPIAIGAGESHKTLASAELVWRELVAAGVTRADRVVAVGGGVVGDVAGFCAATYQRGIAVVQAPTTLVAQVDSAYGGKTGVDLPEAKNYVGAYHQPAAVIVDPDALRTLPAAEREAGWVEVLKTALIAGGELWERVRTQDAVDEQTIVACARLKLAVVAEDERDAGRRQVLNLGHTVGHAIETATGYGRYRHGEAVGLGLLAALRLSGREQLREEVRELLHARGLPVALDGEVGVQAILEALVRDKKRVGAEVPFVLLDAPGEVRVGCEVAPPELRAAVAELADTGVHH